MMSEAITTDTPVAPAEPAADLNQSGPREERWPLLVIVSSVLICYGKAVLNEFTTWDDNTAIYRNPLFNPPTLHSLRVWWTAPTKHLWNPTVNMMQGLLALFPTATYDPTMGTRLNPYLFHATNILFHACSALILYLILRKLRFSAWPACAGALVFAIHPLQVEPVAWASALKDLMYGFFGLWAILVYLRSAEVSAEIETSGYSSHARNLYLAATGLFLLAALSKVTAIMLPAVVMALVLLDPVLLQPRRTLRQMGIWIIASIPFAIITKHLQPASDAATALWQRPLIATDTLAFYLFKLAWPAHLIIDYGRDPHGIFEHGWAYWTWIVPVSMAAALWLARKRARALVVGAIIFVALLLPVLGFSTFDFQFYSTTSDRYLYLSMFGVAIAFAWAVEKGGRAATIVAVLLLGTWAVRSYLQLDYWRNSYALYMHTLDINPDSIAALGNIAGDAYAAGRPDQALEFSLRAKRLRPQDDVARLNLAHVYVKTGHVNLAVQEYRECFPINPANVRGEVIFQTADLAQAGRIADALLMGILAIELSPDSGEAHLNYGSVLGESGNRQAALRELRKAVELDPMNVAAQSNLATMLAASGDLDEAAAHYHAALRLQPGQPAALEGLQRLLAIRLARMGPTSKPTK